MANQQFFSESTESCVAHTCCVISCTVPRARQMVGRIAVATQGLCGPRSFDAEKRPHPSPHTRKRTGQLQCDTRKKRGAIQAMLGANAPPRNTPGPSATAPMSSLSLPLPASRPNLRQPPAEKQPHQQEQRHRCLLRRCRTSDTRPRCR
jgi:hypothetical protein